MRVEKVSCKKVPYPAQVRFEYLFLQYEKTVFPFIGYHTSCCL